MGHGVKGLKAELLVQLPSSAAARDATGFWPATHRHSLTSALKQLQLAQKLIAQGLTTSLNFFPSNCSTLHFHLTSLTSLRSLPSYQPYVTYLIHLTTVSYNFQSPLSFSVNLPIAINTRCDLYIQSHSRIIRFLKGQFWYTQPQ